MADPIIKLKRSSVPGKIPNTTSLPTGEFGINTYDGKVYIQQNQGAVGVGSTIVVVNPWSVGTGTNTYNTYFTSGNVGIGTTIPTSSLYVVGNTNVSGILTAAYFYGDGSNITGIVATGSGIGIQSSGVTIGTGVTIINFVGTGNTFSTNGNVVNVTINKSLTIGTRTTATLINLVGAAFTLSLRSGVGTVTF